MCHHAQQKIYQNICLVLSGLTVLLTGISGPVMAAMPAQEWEAHYKGPMGIDAAVALAMDGAGNVYVTGTSYDNGTYQDYATVKYDANGNQVWVARYNGPGNNADYATALAVDGDGNVFVTGYSRGSGTSFDYATIKYDTNGNQQWLARYNNGYDEATALAVDSSGNVYVTGRSDGSSGSSYTTVKYNTNGNQLWVAHYFGFNGVQNFATALAVDWAGNVYVTGLSYGFGTSTDYATVKYSTNGNQLWVARYNGPGNNYDDASALAVDAAGNVYVTGSSWGGWGTYADYATVKYGANGNQLWVSRYNGPGNNYDEARDLAVDASGHVYVLGHSVVGQSVNSGVYGHDTVKYDTNGNQLWAAHFNGPVVVGGNNIASALAVDIAGNVYTTGLVYYDPSSRDYALAKYDSEGNQIWVAPRRNGPIYYPRALAVDVTGNIYVTGGSNLGFTTIKYSQSPADTTPPVISASQTPLPNLVSWNNSDVTVSFTATDADSPPATCTVNSVTLTAEGAGQVANTTCTDAASNSATASHSVNIDKTAPVLTMPDLAGNYTIGGSALISYAATDTLSGLASVSATLDGEPVNSGSTVMLNQLGNHTFTLTAADMAGNTETRTMQFTVNYAFSGFLSPLTADGRTTFHLGSVIPVKFELFDAHGTAVSAAMARLTLQKLNDGEPVGDPIDATPTSGADSGNLFRYNGGHYMYNLSTKPFSSGTWRIQAALDDGTVRTIDIGLSSK